MNLPVFVYPFGLVQSTAPVRAVLTNTTASGPGPFSEFMTLSERQKELPADAKALLYRNLKALYRR